MAQTEIGGFGANRFVYCGFYCERDSFGECNLKRDCTRVKARVRLQDGAIVHNPFQQLWQGQIEPLPTHFEYRKVCLRYLFKNVHV